MLVRKPNSSGGGMITTERQWQMPMLAALLITILLFIASSFSSSYHHRKSEYENEVPHLRPVFEKPQQGLPRPPRIAYYICGSTGDLSRVKRLLSALYHPRNIYLLHLDKGASDSERETLAFYASKVQMFIAAGNVHVIGNADSITRSGPSALAAVLHGAAILLRLRSDWDWFARFGASDYPLVRQDDLLHVFSYLPKDLNFVAHTSNIGLKEYYRMKPIIIDPGLSMSNENEIFYATQRRVLPNAFKTFTGSSFFFLSRRFVEYCILGWESLPRTILMYSANLLASEETYFQTVICNAKQFSNTTVNNDLCYGSWDTTSKLEVVNLNMLHYKKMMQSGAAFARNVQRDDQVLDRIDREILQRGKEQFTPGGWCVGNSDESNDPCSVWGDISILRTGPRARVLEKTLLKLIANETFRSNQCK